MKSLSVTATRTFLKLVEGLEPGQGRKVDNNKAYMAVQVDFLSRRPYPGFPMSSIEMYAVAHRYEQNGDRISDPDIEFYVLRTAGYQPKVFPTAIDQAGRYRRAVFFDRDGTTEKYYPREQRDIANFCSTVWFKNIRLQQGLK